MVLEIADFRTEEVLARVLDGRAADPMIARESNPVTNISEVRRSVRVWGSALRESLDQLHEIGCYVCTAAAE